MKHFKYLNVTVQSVVTGFLSCFSLNSIYQITQITNHQDKVLPLLGGVANLWLHSSHGVGR